MLEEKSDLLAQLTAQNEALEAELSELKNEYDSSRVEYLLLSSRFEELDDGLIHLQHQNEQLEEKLANANETWSREKLELTKSLETTRNDLQDQQRRKEDAEKDRDFSRDLYAKASAYASEVKDENDALQLRVNVAEGQARDGVAMLKATYAGQVQRLREEIEQLKAQNHVLNVKDERTNDDIRKRAALEPILRQENERLKRELQSCEEELERTRTLVQQSAHPDTEPDHEVENNVGAPTGRDDDNLDDGRPAELHEAEEIAPPSTRSSPAANFNSSDISYVINTNDLSNIVYHVCQYVSGTSMCNAKFSTSQVTPCDISIA